MGLNAGIQVTFTHPFKVTDELFDELQELFWEHLCVRFPVNQTTNLFGSSIDIVGQEKIDLDIRYVHYGSAFLRAGYTFEEMEGTIKTFIVQNFSADEITSMEPYFVP